MHSEATSHHSNDLSVDRNKKYFFCISIFNHKNVDIYLANRSVKKTKSTYFKVLLVPGLVVQCSVFSINVRNPDRIRGCV